MRGKPGRRRLGARQGDAGPGGVFASGTADGHAWRLAVQNIADPGYRCIPAITINGTDADTVDPAPGNGTDVALGAAAPGIGFAFVQVPAGIEGLTIDGRESIPATAATVCGLRYRVVGFAFRLVHPPRITAVTARPGWPRLRAATVTSPQTDGMWNIEGPTSTETARGLADQRNRRG